MDRIDLMRTYLAVAETGSFTAAAERLGMTTQLASKYVRALEDDLGSQLFNRSTRRVSLTPTGAAYFDRCARIVGDFEELRADVRQDHRAPRGALRITAPHCFGGKYLVDALADFATDYPDITIHLDMTDRYVDMLEDGIDVAIRIGSLEDSSMIARRIGSVPVVLCASPAYLASAPPLEEPSDLDRHACIVDTNFRAQNRWSFLIDGQPKTLTVSGRFHVNNASGARTLALRDQGVFLTPGYMVSDDIEAGRLVPVLQDYAVSQMAVSAVYLENRHLSAKIRSFVDFMGDRFRHLK